MKKIFAITFTTLVLNGCATQTHKQVFTAQEIYEKPPIIQVKRNNDNIRLVYGNDPSLERAFNQYTQTGHASNIVTDGFVKFAYNQGQQPIIRTSPFQETVISLEPGEKFTNVSSGDPARWSYSAAVSGTGANLQQNILVKPSLPDISTNMVITTDRRIYNIKLISSNDARSTKSVSFWYPEDMVKQVNSQILKNTENDAIASVPNININNMNFNYSVSSGLFTRTPVDGYPIPRKNGEHLICV